MNETMWLLWFLRALVIIIGALLEAMIFQALHGLQLSHKGEHLDSCIDNKQFMTNLKR